MELDSIQSAQVKIPPEAVIDDMVSRATRLGNSEAREIADTCAVVGKANLIQGFLLMKKPLSEVRAYILKLRAEASGPDLITGVLPGSDAKVDGGKQGNARPWKEVLKSLGFLRGTTGRG